GSCFLTLRAKCARRMENPVLGFVERANMGCATVGDRGAGRVGRAAVSHWGSDSRARPGQEVYPLPDVEPVWCVVATPGIGVSTPKAFGDWDAYCAAEGLTQEASTAKLNKLSRAYASAFAGAVPGGWQEAGSSGVLPYGEDQAGPQESALVRTGISSWIQNDFERVVFPQHPSLAEIKRLLAASDTPE